jgi:hypothetical protein
MHEFARGFTNMWTASKFYIDAFRPEGPASIPQRCLPCIQAFFFTISIEMREEAVRSAPELRIKLLASKLRDNLLRIP